MNDAPVAWGHRRENDFAPCVPHFRRHLVREFHKRLFAAEAVVLRVNKDAVFGIRRFIDDAVEQAFKRIKRLPMFPNEQRRRVGYHVQMRVAVNHFRFDFPVNAYPG